VTAELNIAVARHPGSLTKELDLTKDRFLGMVERARLLKQQRAEGLELPMLLDKNIALIFEKKSTRTRCAFEVAAHDQGAHVTYIGPEDSHLGRTESVVDSARVLGRIYDGIQFRGFAHHVVEELADNAGVPVWNGLTDDWHPTQMLADVMTMLEHKSDPVERISYCFLGDARNNVARSLLITGSLLGMDVRIAAPKQLWPPGDVVGKARAMAAASGARIVLTHDPALALHGADFIYTDVWVSLGEAIEQWDVRVPQLRPYRVTSEIMRATYKPDTKFMHCLPALHDRASEAGRRLYERYGLDGCEVTDEVFESAASIVFDQAENRMHTIKAMMLDALEA